MPKSNGFRHQSYSVNEPSSPWQLIRAGDPYSPDSPEFRQLLQSAARAYQRAEVAAIFLVHGTFAGDDALGFIHSVSRIFPPFAERARQAHKQASDRLLRDAGNYTAQYAERLQQDSGIPVHVFHWSSENHHLARADAAICLIDRIAAFDPSTSKRVLLWGHSHGGNVFALMTNLLAAESSTRRRFFRAARSYYRGSASRRDAASAWYRVRDFLRHGGGQRLPKLDLVTFGTPIRYGWDTDGYGQLLHFVHHRPRTDLPPYRTGLPRSFEDILSADDGDYPQHLGIAGTNLTPNVFSWRSWLADVRLGRLLQSGVRRSDLLRRLQAGVRVADEGLTLLVDYGRTEESFPLNLAGHAVYTRLRWLPFHACEIARRFYGAVDDVQGGP